MEHNPHSPQKAKPVSEELAGRARETAEAIYRTESRRVFATLIRLLGDFDLAEEALHDAFRAALEQWPRDGVPANPRAWLVSAGRFKAIDGIRRRARFDSIEDVAEQVEAVPRDPPPWDDESVEDDRLRLIFTCCHPASGAGRTGGADAARSVRPDDGRDRQRLPQRRADAGPADRAREGEDPRRAHPVPGAGARTSCPQRLDSVLRVIYLVFNEGYSASSGESLTRRRSVRRSDSSRTAAGRIAAGARGDRAACADAAARIAARGAHVADGRADPAGRSGPIAVESRADRGRIGVGGAGASRSRRFGPYTMQAAIAAVHAERASAPTRPTGRDRRAL